MNFVRLYMGHALLKGQFRLTLLKPISLLYKLPRLNLKRHYKGDCNKILFSLNFNGSFHFFQITVKFYLLHYFLWTTIFHVGHFSCRPKSTKLLYLRCNWSRHNKQSGAHGFFEFDSKSGIPSPFLFFFHFLRLGPTTLLVPNCVTILIKNIYILTKLKGTTNCSQ